MNENTQAGTADTVLAGLKDFQRRTVDWVFERLYEPGASGRFLVADEVGLGKTLVARGVIARAIDHLRGKVPRIDVLYICSNGDIARQNIQRLKLSGSRSSASSPERKRARQNIQSSDMDGDAHVAITSRLTMLPLDARKLKGTPTGVNFISFTPATSFDLRDGLGQVHERVLLYWMLRKAWLLGTGKAAMNVFRGQVGVDRFRRHVEAFDPTRIDVSAQEAFERALSKRMKQDIANGADNLRTQLDDLCRAFSTSSRTIDPETSRARSRFVGALRSVVAASCIELLEPDIVILDEFQRFSHLLDDEEDEASMLAREVFEYPKVRVLLLSATPYKMYTVSDDGGEDDHYRDFVRTIRFLESKAAGARPIEHDMEAYQSAVLGLTQSEGPERLRAATQRLAERLRRVMVRTERLASTPDRNGMLREVPTAPLALRPTDVLDYLAVEAVSRVVGQRDCIEYWKSAPYVLNFLDDGYKLKTELRKALEVADQRMKVAQALSVSPTATLPWNRIHRYHEVDPGNPRMRAFVDDFLGGNAHRLLWIPPAMPYYALGGAFADEGVAQLTKRLVFSSWRAVPRAIAAMLSYEVERRVFSDDPAAEYSPEYRAKRRALLRFGAEPDGRLTGMAVLALLYPSLYLAEACDPATLAVDLATSQLHGSAPSNLRAIPAADVLELAKGQIQLAVERHLPPARTDGPADERWYWAAPLLLDRKLRPATTLAWFQQEHLAAAWSGADDAHMPVEGEEHGGRDHWAEHVAEARAVAVDGATAVTSAHRQKALGRMPDDLVDVLARLAIGGPAVTMLRAMLHVVGGESALDEKARTALRNGAGSTAWAFRALFNQPE
jgi:hypothetical protein